MKSEITKIEVNQTAKTLAIVASILTLFLSVFSLIALAFGFEIRVSFNYIISVAVSGTGGKVVLLLAYPILTFILAYLTTSVLCLIYNFTAKFTGGIKVRLRS